MKRLDVRREIHAVLEIELFLAAFFRRARGVKSPRGRVLEDGRAELLVYEDAGVLFRHISGDGGLESVVDHLLSLRDLRRLLAVERAVPAKHAGLKRAAMVEGKNVEWLLVSARGHGISLVISLAGPANMPDDTFDV